MSLVIRSWHQMVASGQGGEESDQHPSVDGAVQLAVKGSTCVPLLAE